MVPEGFDGYFGPLFIRTGNGEYVPFPGIQEMTLPKTDDPAYTDSIQITDTCEATIQMEITNRFARRFYKMIRADINHARRRRRRFKRLKEKVRRNTLKYGR